MPLGDTKPYGEVAQLVAQLSPIPLARGRERTHEQCAGTLCRAGLAMTWWKWTLLGIALWAVMVLFVLALFRAASSPAPRRSRRRAPGRSARDLPPLVVLDDARARRSARSARATGTSAHQIKPGVVADLPGQRRPRGDTGRAATREAEGDNHADTRRGSAGTER